MARMGFQTAGFGKALSLNPAKQTARPKAAIDAAKKKALYEISRTRVIQAGGVASLPASSLTPTEAEAIRDAKMTAEGDDYELNDLED